MKNDLNPNHIYMENYSEDYRDLYRLVLLYGCFTGSDIDKAVAFPLLHREDGKSFIRKSTYSTKIKQLMYLLSDEYLQVNSNNVKVTHSVDSDIYSNKDDFIHKTFKMHNFTSGQLLQFFVLLQSAQAYTEEFEVDYFSMNNLATYILDAYEDDLQNVSSDFKKLIQDMQLAHESNQGKPFRAVFDNMVDAGYFIQIKDSEEIADSDNSLHSFYYQIAENLLDYVEDNTLNHLYYLLNHLSKTDNLKVPYYLAKQRLLTYSYVSGREIFENTDKILYRHNHNYMVLDDEITYKLMNNIQQKQCISMICKYTSQDYSADDTYEKRIVICQPLKLIQNHEDGRQFLFAVDSTQKAIIMRLDYILEVARIDSFIIDDEQSEIYLEKLQKYVWCASPYNFDGDLREIKLLFTFTSQDFHYISKLYKDIAQQYKIEKQVSNDENKKEYMVTIMVYDFYELIPWISSFGNHVKVLQNNDESIELDNILQKQKQEVKKNYGII